MTLSSITCTEWLYSLKMKPMGDKRIWLSTQRHIHLDKTIHFCKFIHNHDMKMRVIDDTLPHLNAYQRLLYTYKTQPSLFIHYKSISYKTIVFFIHKLSLRGTSFLYAKSAFVRIVKKSNLAFSILKYSGKNWRVPWLQQHWYWLCWISVTLLLYSKKKDFEFLCHLNVWIIESIENETTYMRLCYLNWNQHDEGKYLDKVVNWYSVSSLKKITVINASTWSSRTRSSGIVVFTRCFWSQVSACSERDLIRTKLHSCRQASHTFPIQDQHIHTTPKHFDAFQWYQKQVSQAWISNWIPQKTVECIY